MNKYIDADKLKAEIERLYDGEAPKHDQQCDFDDGYFTGIEAISRFIDSLQQEQTDMGEVSDGYHTFNELYRYRMLYNAAFFNLLPKEWVHKSKRHHTGEECFGGRWFIVTANLPTGQISNHYELKDWDLFKVPEKEFTDEWDGHTPQEAAERLYKYLQEEQLEVDSVEEITDKSRACCNCINGIPQYPNCYCWQHKDCNTDEPYKIPKKDWIETAKTCKEFEFELGLNARK